LPTPLSRDGERRREQILRLAQRTAAARGRRRRHARGAVGIAMLLAIAAVIGLRFGRVAPKRDVADVPRPIPIPTTPGHSPSPSSIPPPVAVAAAPARPARPEIVITRIKTAPGLADRLAIRRDPAAWQRLSDDDLLHRLSDAGKPAGLAYVDGRAMLLFRDDPRLGPRGSSPSAAPHWRPSAPTARHAHEGQPF
jgi:hypothetical protein